MSSTELVRVEIVRAETMGLPPHTEVTHRVTNALTSPIWLVNDPWFTFRRHEMEIELSFKRERLRSGAQPFGYFVPEVQRIVPGTSFERHTTLTWPVALSPLWNESPMASVPPGTYELRVVVGFGHTPKPSSSTSSDIEGPVLSWQEQSTSDAVGLDVPQHDRPPDGHTT
jgi:hypothetical protein